MLTSNTNKISTALVCELRLNVVLWVIRCDCDDIIVNTKSVCMFLSKLIYKWTACRQNALQFA